MKKVLKKFKSDDAIIMKGQGTFHLVDFKGKELVPLPGEEIFIDSIRYRVKKAHLVKCVCGKCFSGGILV